MNRFKGLSGLTLVETPKIGDNSRVSNYIPVKASRFDRAKLAPHDPTWCEENGLPDLVNGPKNLKYGHITADAMANKWSETVQAYIAGNLKFKDLQAVLHSKCFGVVGIKNL